MKFKSLFCSSLTVFIFLNTSFLFAQNFKNIDWVYQENIKTARFLPARVSQTFTNFDKKAKTLTINATTELELMPILSLGESGSISFDDMDGDFKFYRYKVELRNADWSPTQLNEQEYVEGFAEYRLNEGKLAFGTISNYTHYELEMSNANTRLTKSGNYLLHIFVDNDEKTPILTRRFVVAEQLTRINMRFVPTGDASKTYTHHEIDFDVEHDKYRISNPKNEVKAVILQNGRWDNCKKAIPPTFARPNELLYDYQDSIVFPAGNEFRFLDIRSLMSRGFHIQKVRSTKKTYDVTVENDRRRIGDTYTFSFDNNGAYLINTKDAPRGDLDHRLQSEYANVLFTLDLKEELEDTDLYIVGKFSDWNTLPQNKMFYDEVSHTYISEIFLKQGFYDYAYAAVKKGSTKLNLEEVDNNLYQTDNAYTVILYHRPPGARYDRIIGLKTIGSAPDKR